MMSLFLILFFILVGLTILRGFYVLIMRIKQNQARDEPAPRTNNTNRSQNRVFVITRPVNRPVVTSVRLRDDDDFIFVPDLLQPSTPRTSLPPAYEELNTRTLEKNIDQFPPPPAYDEVVPNIPAH